MTTGKFINFCITDGRDLLTAHLVLQTYGLHRTYSSKIFHSTWSGQRHLSSAQCRGTLRLEMAFGSLQVRLSTQPFFKTAGTKRMKTREYLGIAQEILTMPQVTFSQLASRHVSVYVLLNARIIIASLNFCSTKKIASSRNFCDC